MHKYAFTVTTNSVNISDVLLWTQTETTIFKLVNETEPNEETTSTTSMSTIF